jgi:hypothetical protein
MATISVKPAIIAARASMSSAVDLTGTTATVGVIMPQAVNWSPAIVTVLGSADGTTFYDLFDGTAGIELVFNARPGSMVMLNPNRMRCCRAVMLRSGTHNAPVIQAIACTFGVVVES